MKRIFFLALLLIFFPLAVSGSLGPNVSQTADGKTLRWEEGSRDYFVMFKSLVEDRHGNATFQSGNPQADSCIDYNVGSTFTLEAHHIPEDAYVEAAYLIWTAGADPSLFNGGNTDNSVLLSFSSEGDSVSLSEYVTSSVTGTFQTPPSFEYEALQSGIADTGYFTYRVDVTDFMQEIIEQGREAGSAFDGYSLLGNYNVKEMTCTNHSNYVDRSLVVGDWVLFFVYTSEKIRPKKIYVYNGFSEYQHTFEDINVTGFMLPDEAEMRLTLVVHEGDPGNVSGTKNPEALSLSGAQTFDWVQLTNICNPPLSYLGMDYVEVYNSVSSLYGWQDTIPYCVGGIPPNYNLNELQYAIDVDTFFMSAKDPVYEPHLIKGDDNFWLKVSANQDVIYTNLLVLSIDTKTPKFDIPPNTNTPDGREKNYCSCSPDSDAICDDRPFYFTIKVENWGENIAHDVTVVDELPPLVEYISGTTEMLVKKDGVTGNWEKIEDSGGGFPLSSPIKIADSMYYCNKATFECEDSILIRFKVKPIETIQKHQVVKNTAIITDNSGIAYYSNSSVPLRLRLGDCPVITECPEPPKEECGGLDGDVSDCEIDDDCEDGQTCSDDGKCVAESADLTKDTEIAFAKGINSPESEGSSIIIPNPSKDLVVAQFTLLADGDKDKSFEFHGINIAVTKSEKTTSLTKIRLVHDKGATGKVAENDNIIATVDTLSGNTVNLTVMDGNDRSFSAGTLHSFLVVLDTEHPGEVTSNVSFNLEITGPEAVLVKDAGKPVVTGSKIEFASFRFEPEDGFIFTKGENDPEVPTLDKMKGMVPVLQIRTKSMQGDDTLRSIDIRPTARSVKFGEGIGKAELYLDKDNNGIVTETDEKIGETDISEGGYMKFEGLNVSYGQGEEKHLVVVLDLKLKDGEMAQIMIRSGRVKLADTSKNIAELPVTSKEFLYECQEGDPSCKDAADSKNGCSCNMVAAPQDTSYFYLFFMLIISSILLVLRTFS